MLAPTWGLYSLLGSRLVGTAGRVVAVEASLAFHAALIDQVRPERVIIQTIKAVVADRNQKLTFVLASTDNLGANSILPYGCAAESTFDIKAQPLPELLWPVPLRATD